MQHKPIREQVLDQLRKVWHSLEPGEQELVNILAHNRKPISQQTLADSIPSLRGHSRHDPGAENRETTLRRIRQVIRDLRVEHHIVILSNTKGYWIPNTNEEAEDYLDTFEKQARAAAKAFMVTFHSMRQGVEGLREREPIVLLDSSEE